LRTGELIVMTILGLAVALANGAYWWWIARRGETRFRAWCERRYGVAITYGFKGHWKVTGPRSWWSRVGIEWLQLAYFLGAMLVWGCAMLGAVLAMMLAQRAIG
jgi:hypothetical protein